MGIKNQFFNCCTFSAALWERSALSSGPGELSRSSYYEYFDRVLVNAKFQEGINQLLLLSLFHSQEILSRTKNRPSFEPR